MQRTLLATKFYFPTARPTLVARPRLVQRLQDGLRGPLTLLSAPAGYGKTTLLSEWRAGPGAGMPAAWLSLDTADNDPARFLHYLAAALNSLRPGLLAAIEPLLPDGSPPDWESILTLLINHFSSQEGDALLVLDDYHLMETASIHQAMDFLLEHLPPPLHLVMLARSDPPLPLSRLRARGQLVEIRAGQLRFSLEECSEFLNRCMGLQLTAGQVASLEKRTEGWIAGLQLAAIACQASTPQAEHFLPTSSPDTGGFIAAFTGSNRYILDFLMEEVFSHQAESRRAFLLKTSLLERFTGSLCDAITGEESGEETLAALERANLFIIPLDSERGWFRYHHLFADLLRSRLLHTYPDLVPSLHGRASAWLEAHGYIDEALQHALQGAEYESAARLLCRDRLDLLYMRSLSTLEAWLAAFPEAFLLGNPWLCIAKAHVLWASGSSKDITPYVQAAESTLERQLAEAGTSPDDLEVDILRGDILTFRALLAMRTGSLEHALTLAQQAADRLPPMTRSRVFALGGLYTMLHLSGDLPRAAEVCREAVQTGRALNYPSMHMSSTYTLAQYLRTTGQLRQAVEVMREAIEYAAQKGQARLFYTHLLHCGLAECLYEQNELDEMEAELMVAQDLGGGAASRRLGMLSMRAQANLLHARGDRTGALHWLDEIERESGQVDPQLYRESLHGLRLQWQAEGGNLAGLAEWLSRIDLQVGAKIGTVRFSRLVQAAQLQITLGQEMAARQVLEGLEAMATHNGCWGWLVIVLALQALACWKTGEQNLALKTLERALKLAEPEGFKRPFLDLGLPGQEMLRALVKHRGGSDFVTHLLPSFAPPPVPAAPPRLLSKREIELLQLIAAGAANKEIAQELFISLGTVKRHTVNIFTKLEVKNRTEAVARARELGILNH